jgi:hypothetical protein
VNLKIVEVYTLKESLLSCEAVCAFLGHMYSKGKPYKCGIIIYELYETKSVCVCDIKVYQDACSADLECNCLFSIVNIFTI